MLLNWHHLIASAVSSQYFSVYLEGSMVIAFVCPSTFIRLIIEIKGGVKPKNDFVHFDVCCNPIFPKWVHMSLN